VADKETTFYQGPKINSALGICVLGNQAIVSCSPNVFLFTDTDGDGKADKQEVLFSGISGVDHDHGVHSGGVRAGRKLYFISAFFPSAQGQDGKPVIDLVRQRGERLGKPSAAGCLACNLDGSEVEVLAHNFRNHYEVAVDSFAASGIGQRR